MAVLPSIFYLCLPPTLRPTALSTHPGAQSVRFPPRCPQSPDRELLESSGFICLSSVSANCMHCSVGCGEPGAHTLQRPFQPPHAEPCLRLSHSPAVGVTGRAVPWAHGAVPEVPQESDVGTEVESALKGHAGVQQSRGGGREPAGDDPPLRPDAAGLRGHAAQPAGGPHHHAVPAVGPPRGRAGQVGDRLGQGQRAAPRKAGAREGTFSSAGTPQPPWFPAYWERWRGC